MAKIRIINRYGVAPNHLLNDSRITFKAKWLYTYIQSKPDDWSFSSKRIIKETKDWLDAVQSWLRELEEFWYLKRIKEKDDKWQWEWVYILHESPIQENPVQKSPVQENPVQGKPVHNKEIDTKKDIQINNNIYTLFDFRNSSWIIKHKNLKQKEISLLQKRLKEYTFEEIKMSIGNYAKIFLSKDTYFNHKWTFFEFLQRENGMPVFLYKTEKDYFKNWKNKASNAYVEKSDLSVNDIYKQLNITWTL